MLCPMKQKRNEIYCHEKCYGLVNISFPIKYWCYLIGSNVPKELGGTANAPNTGGRRRNGKRPIALNFGSILALAVKSMLCGF